MPTYDQVAEQIQAIESELRRLGRWQAAPLPAEAYQDMGAFGMNTMAFEQWLQFILIPNVRAIITSQGDFPDSSAVGVVAMRNFDTDREAADLQRLLFEFDRLFEES